MQHRGKNQLLLVVILKTTIVTNLGQFRGPGTVGGIEVDLFDQLHVGEKGDEGDEVGVGHLVPTVPLCE